uniref:Swi5-dependent recombination DNA repair protein 1 homolog n=1 Tax=Ciona intestinalis TaxID=7719 RepID=F7BMF5_CIOIN|nr:swi5-dependent recombination DNA repair protein 1 homolog [Ciona intestinalis]|eukprot:XP_002131875.1 swi5-dependent recombination DNA repair protein 1 homolog [Ciona intestinalis]
MSNTNPAEDENQLNDVDNEDAWMLSEDVELVLKSCEQKTENKVTLSKCGVSVATDEKENIDLNNIGGGLGTPVKTEALDLHVKMASLREQHRRNEERLAKLKRLKSYKDKNNLQTLESLIIKWRKVCQEALGELIEFTPKEPKPTMFQLLHHLSIDTELVNFDTKKLEFIK